MGKAILVTKMEPRKLKRVVLKEEFVAITGCSIQAILLSQFLYWSERVKDFDQFILEEKQRNPEIAIELTHGWIYKKASDLLEETMICKSEDTVRRAIKALIEKGWLIERDNPRNPWDKTKQYRIDLWNLHRALADEGYPLDGYFFPKRSTPPSPKGKDQKPETLYLPNPHFADSKPHLSGLEPHFADSEAQNADSRPHFADTYIGIQRLQTEITNRERVKEPLPPPHEKVRPSHQGDILRQMFEPEETPWFVDGDRNKFYPGFAEYVLKTLEGMGAYEKKAPTIANAKTHILGYMAKQKGSDERFYLHSKTKHLWDEFKAIEDSPEQIDKAVGLEFQRLGMNAVLPEFLQERWSAYFYSELSLRRKKSYLGWLQRQEPYAEVEEFVAQPG